MIFTRYSVPTAKVVEGVSVPDTVLTPETLIPRTVLPVATSLFAGSSKRHFTMKLSDAGGEPKSITEMVCDPKIDAIWLNGPNHARIENVEEVCAAVSSGNSSGMK